MIQNKPNMWKDIRGFEGKYQISYCGEVRRIYGSGKTRLLKPYRKASEQGRKIARNRLMVGLIDEKGKKHCRWVHQLVAEHFLPPPKPGQVPYHINGVVTDNWASNIGYISRSELGKKTGHISKAQAVIKIDRNGELVDSYRSAREAAKACFMSYQTIIDRCNGGYKKNGRNHSFKSVFAPDGFAYCWDKEKDVLSTQRRIERELILQPVIVETSGYDVSPYIDTSPEQLNFI